MTVSWRYGKAKHLLQAGTQTSFCGITGHLKQWRSSHRKPPCATCFRLAGVADALH